MKFSHCGRLLATAGQNNVIWVWVLKDYYAYFNDLRNKYDSKGKVEDRDGHFRIIRYSKIIKPNLKFRILF